MSRVFAAGPGVQTPTRTTGEGRKLAVEALWMLCPSVATTALLLLSLQLPWQPEASQIKPEAPAMVRPGGSTAVQPAKTLELQQPRQKAVWRMAAQE